MPFRQPLMMFEEVASEVEEVGEALLGEVTAILESPWVIGTAAAVAAFELGRRSVRRAGSPPDSTTLEVPGVTVPRELS